METKECMTVNIIASDEKPENRAAAIKILKEGMGYADSEITEVKVGQSAEWDAETCDAKGSKNAPEKAKFLYIAKG